MRIQLTNTSTAFCSQTQAAPRVWTRKVAISLVSAGALLGACSFDASTQSIVESETDAAIEDIDANRPPQPHLLLSEVRLETPEFIEIHNPGDFSLSLSNYYISDSPQYFKLPAFIVELQETGEGPVIGNSDFIARFPPTAEIGAGESLFLVISCADWEGSDLSQLGGEPDYCLDVPTLTQGNSERMREAYSGSRGGTQVSLTNNGEGIVLFEWDGESDLVQDVDFLIAGTELNGPNRLEDKSGVAIDGPDEDAEPSEYLQDAMTIQTFSEGLTDDKSYSRIALEEEEDQEGGNGIAGHDETSENAQASWGIRVASPGIVTIK